MTGVGQRLFAYGTLEIPEVMRAVVGRLPWACSARLDGYTRRLLVGRAYPGIVARADASTTGTLYDGIEPAEWEALDAFEDDCYERCRLEVVTHERKRVEAVVYAIPPDHAHEMTDTEWNREVYEEEHLVSLLHAWSARAHRGGEAR